MAEPLPLYVQDEVPQTPFDVLLTRIAVPISYTYPDARTILESFVESQKAPAYDGTDSQSTPAYDAPETTSKSCEPIDHYPPSPKGSIADELTRVKQEIVRELFTAIQREDGQAIALLIQHNLVTANTTSNTGQTPLVEAVSTKSLGIVKEVLDLGADFNAFGVVPGRLYGTLGQGKRTPLMLAASMGSLSIVKLLFEPPYSADDALVAPDGQIALRLAAEHNHRAIVDYLPARRAGGYLRFKTHNARSIERIKDALHMIWVFVRFFGWYVPKFFVWSIPKHLVVLPVVRSCKWCWANKERFGLWCKYQLTETPKRIARFGKATWKVAKDVPKSVWNMATKVPKAVWNMAKKVSAAVWKVAKKIPGAVWKVIKESPGVIWNAIKKISKAVKELGKALGKALWHFLTVGIPKALGTASKWVWGGISSLARSIGDIFLRLLSFLHTVFEGVITFLRRVTLKDIWNALCEFLRAVFVTLPKTIWSWIESFGEASYKVMGALLGEFGRMLWWIVVILKEMVAFVPRMLGVILHSVAGSFVKAFSEVRVWFSPKA